MKYKFIIVFTVLIGLCIGSAANAQLKLTLTSEKETYKLSEPVIVYVSVTNTGSSSIKIPAQVEPEWTDYVYFVTGPGHAFNAAYVDGIWEYIDTQVAAAKVKGKPPRYTWNQMINEQGYSCYLGYTDYKYRTICGD